MSFARDIMESTLQSVRDEHGQQWPLPLSEEAVDDIWACDWEEQSCPACGHDLDNHNSRTITRCANTDIHVPRSY